MRASSSGSEKHEFSQCYYVTPAFLQALPAIHQAHSLPSTQGLAGIVVISGVAVANFAEKLEMAAVGATYAVDQLAVYPNTAVATPDPTVTLVVAVLSKMKRMHHQQGIVTRGYG